MHLFLNKPKYWLAICWLAGLTACTSDKLPPNDSPAFCDNLFPTYSQDVKTIIDESCAYSGCHDGAGGIGPFNYTDYKTLSDYLDTKMAVFRDRVFDQKEDPVIGMPPDQSVYPESFKDDLTEQELEVLRCWLDSGYPEF
ncbi:MAG TPA: hypothetical protein ENJ20_02475 [Bacteroidetes bacterium]|nr:hypothetical protein [Bacteroidota bacterium]